MRTTFCTAFLILSTVASAQQTPPPSRRLDHLMPVTPYRLVWKEHYIKACYRLLRVDDIEADGEGHLRKAVAMVTRPAFDGESCVTLRERRGDDGPELIFVSASRNIYYSLPEYVNGEFQRREGPPRKVEIRTIEKAIDRARADRIYGLWERMLHGVRYPKVRPGGLEDGMAYEFRWSSKRLFGEIDDPEGGPPEALVHLGEAMAKVCEEFGGPESLERLDKACDELEKRLAEAEKR